MSKTGVDSGTVTPSKEEAHDAGSQDVESRQVEDSGEFNLAAQGDQLERGLKSRHIQFLALGMFTIIHLPVGIYQ